MNVSMTRVLSQQTPLTFLISNLPQPSSLCEPNDLVIWVHPIMERSQWPSIESNCNPECRCLNFIATLAPRRIALRC